jgi:hypothetical protein
VQLAESGELKESIEILGSIITANPSHLSAYVNRAHAHMLNNSPDSALGDVEALLALPSVPSALRARALIQKSMVLRLRGQEEEARAAMEAAASLGDAFAKTEAVKMNPYAAMCNAMLASVAKSMEK